MRLFISSLLTCLITATVHAEVVKSNEDGFIVKHTATVSTDEAGTMINWKYHVYGNSETDIPALATAVDGVLAEQIGRLMEYLNSGN